MAMKMYNKSECEYKGGYIVCEGKVVCVDNEVVDLFNKIEEDIQRAKFERESCGPLPCYKEPAEFTRTTEHDKIPHIEAATPTLDAAEEKAVKIMDEIDAIADAKKINDYFGSIGPVIMFVNDEFIVSGEHAAQHRFDLPTIGNPLELDKGGLADLIVSMFE